MFCLIFPFFFHTKLTKRPKFRVSAFLLPSPTDSTPCPQLHTDSKLSRRITISPQLLPLCQLARHRLWKNTGGCCRTLALQEQKINRARSSPKTRIVENQGILSGTSVLVPIEEVANRATDWGEGAVDLIKWKEC